MMAQMAKCIMMCFYWMRSPLSLFIYIIAVAIFPPIPEPLLIACKYAGPLCASKCSLLNSPFTVSCQVIVPLQRAHTCNVLFEHVSLWGLVCLAKWCHKVLNLPQWSPLCSLCDQTSVSTACDLPSMGRPSALPIHYQVPYSENLQVSAILGFH